MLRYMDYAYTIYKEKSFTKAAEKLYISQPSLSLTIKKLENEIGYPIFERCGKEITLTHIGEKYISAIEEIMHTKTRFENEIDDLLKLRQGSITIGSTTFHVSYLLPDILKKFRNKYPGVKIDIKVEQSTTLEEKLEKGEIDIIIDNTIYRDSRYEYIPLFKEQILIGIPRDYKINDVLKDYEIKKEDIINNHNFEHFPRINVSDLRNENFILLKHGNKMRQISGRIFEEANISPKTELEFDILTTSVNYAENGFGICFLTDTFIKNVGDFKNLTLYFPDTEYKSRTLYIIYKKSKYLTTAASELIDFIKS